MKRQIVFFAAAAILLLPICSSAQMLYATGEYTKQLDLVNMVTGQVSVVYSMAGIGAKPDSLLLNSQGQIIYTVTNLGLLGMYDTGTGINTVLASGLSYPRDLVFDFGTENSLLIANYARGQILRYNMITGTVSILAKNLGSTDGLAYDAAGNLFVVAHHNKVCQIDPTLGTVLNCIVIEPAYKVNGADGLTYDPYSGQLWATHIGTIGNGLMEIPTDLSSVTFFQTGNIHTPDGVQPDGYGNLYIGATLQHIVVYNIPTDTITKSVYCKSVDDIALIPGTY